MEEYVTIQGLFIEKDICRISRNRSVLMDLLESKCKEYKEKVLQNFQVYLSLALLKILYLGWRVLFSDTDGEN